MRVSSKQLHAKAEIVSSLTGRDIQIYSAYGGWDVHEIVNEHRGVSSLMGGCGPAKECDKFLSGMIAAARMMREV